MSVLRCWIAATYAHFQYAPGVSRLAVCGDSWESLRKRDSADANEWQT